MFNSAKLPGHFFHEFLEVTRYKCVSVCVISQIPSHNPYTSTDREGARHSSLGLHRETSSSVPKKRDAAWFTPASIAISPVSVQHCVNVCLSIWIYCQLPIYFLDFNVYWGGTFFPSPNNFKWKIIFLWK